MRMVKKCGKKYKNVGKAFLYNKSGTCTIASSRRMRTLESATRGSNTKFFYYFTSFLQRYICSKPI